MTRYACFWVENGEMICPIENMRFDDTIFRLLGDSLEALTEERSYHASSYSYGMRWLGGTWVPGALLSKMRFTI
jgi:predicted Zn-dependent protease